MAIRPVPCTRLTLDWRQRAFKLVTGEKANDRIRDAVRTVITPTTQDFVHVGALVEHLHTAREDERVALSRKMHDEMGGLLVSAAMDLGWAEAHSSSSDVSARLRRLGTTLASAIDLERRIIEQLRPTLLDTFGLFEALRWYFKHACRPSKAQCHEILPADEIGFTPSALSHIFRATQALLDCTFVEQELGSVDLKACVHGDALSVTLGHEHLGTEPVDILRRFEFELGSAAHRVMSVGGELSFESFDRGAVFHLTVPLIKGLTLTAQ